MPTWKFRITSKSNFSVTRWIKNLIYPRRYFTTSKEKFNCSIEWTIILGNNRSNKIRSRFCSYLDWNLVRIIEFLVTSRKNPLKRLKSTRCLARRLDRIARRFTNTSISLSLEIPSDNEIANVRRVIMFFISHIFGVCGDGGGWLARAVCNSIGYFDKDTEGWTRGKVESGRGFNPQETVSNGPATLIIPMIPALFS